MDVSGEEDVEGLCLTHEGGAVGGVFDQPALVDLKGGFENVFFIIGQEVEMLDGAFVGEDRTPCLLYTSPSPRDQRGSRMPSSA